MRKYLNNPELVSINMINKLSNLNHRCILVAEDDFFIADNLCQLLMKLNANILGPFSNVAEALTLIGKPIAIHGAILDATLNDGSSLRIANALAAQKIPFLFSSGRMLAELALAYPEVINVIKPAEPVDVAKALARIMT